MIRLDRSLSQIHSLERLAMQDKWLNGFHPLCKLILTVLFIVVAVSFAKYDLFGLLGMALYLLILFQLGDYSFRDGLKRMKLILPVVCIMGIANPFLDREIVLKIGTLAVSGGVLSMVTLIIKGFFTVFAGYLLVVSTPIDKICSSLRQLHVPKILVTVFLLIYRYVSLFMEEALLLSQAYALRAPHQKGIQFKSWGSLVGQFLLRSIDRSREIFQSMTLRGFQGEYPDSESSSFRPRDLVFLLTMGTVILVPRFVPVFSVVGNFCTNLF